MDAPLFLEITHPFIFHHGINHRNQFWRIIRLNSSHAQLLACTLPHLLLMVPPQLAMVDHLDLGYLARATTKERQTLQRYILGRTKSGSLREQSPIERIGTSSSTPGSRLMFRSILEQTLVPTIRPHVEFMRSGLFYHKNLSIQAWLPGIRIDI